MDEPSNALRRALARKANNEEFLRRLRARRPAAKPQYEALAIEGDEVLEVAIEAIPPGTEAGAPPWSGDEMLLETIVRRERPVLFVKEDWIDVVDVTAFGEEAKDLIADLDARRADLQPLMPLIGRIDVTGFPGNDYLGTGWFVDADIVVTNRHVASLIARWDGRKLPFRAASAACR